MTTLCWSPTSIGAEYRPPRFRLYRAAVVAAPEASEGQAAGWGAEVRLADWVPLRVDWRANGAPSTLTLRCVLGVGPGRPVRGRPEDAALAAGDRIRLVEVVAGGPEGTRTREWVRGYVGQQRLLVQGDPSGATADVVAYGPEVLLRGKVVSGQWHARAPVDEAVVAGDFEADDLVRANTFRSHLPAIFNRDGRPNASPAASGGFSARWHLDAGATAETANAAVFEGPGRKVSAAGGTYEAAFWDAATAVRSLLEMIDGYAVVAQRSVALLPEALADLPLGEADVEGLSLPDALRAVLTPLGYGFCIEPWAGEDGRHALRVFALQGTTTGSRVKRPYMAPIHGQTVHATDLAGHRAEVRRIDFVRDNHGVSNDVTVIGAQRRTQVTLTFAAGSGDLKPLWDTDEHDLADWASGAVIDPMQWPAPGHGENTLGRFEQRYAYGAAGKGEYAHVFRSFTWNEDGAFNAIVGGMPDLGPYGTGESDGYVRRPRPVGATLLRDEGDGKVRNVQPFVQLGVEGDDDSWIQVPAVIWADRAGFTLPIDPLWGWYPYADHYARHTGDDSETLYEQYGHLSYLTLLYGALNDSGTKLTLRLVGSVECDEAVVGRAGRRVSGSWPLPAARVVRAENRYHLRDVPAGSDPFGLGSDRHDSRDDGHDATCLAERIRDTLAGEVGHGSILLRAVTRAYAPGDAIPRTEGRRIDLTVRGGDGTSAPIVVGVAWLLEGGRSHTELLLDTPMLRAGR